MKTIELGGDCIYCFNSTSAGSGRYANRAPSDTQWEITTYGGCGDTYVINVTGWACAECLALPCNRCDTRDSNYMIENNEVLCSDCYEKVVSNV